MEVREVESSSLKRSGPFGASIRQAQISDSRNGARPRHHQYRFERHLLLKMNKSLYVRVPKSWCLLWHQDGIFSKTCVKMI